ncbi:hypothetical protein N7520_003114 [Penicillium odoratum]|uniref:uncharacterized protein n=1 Tax=Penicillium odoratum TaxID=1167516 RepID=UPI0025491F6C|nr:uncharacterized protein N7520_003114 [Penicillium odoratum]KAJ5772585.1 hypothetical protein N7520_003114 [Penicillium odoratum]
MRFISDELVINRDDKAPLQVLGVGLPRCATSSMQAAMESKYINYHPCMHMAYIAPHAGRGDILLEALREPNTERRHKLLHQIFDGFHATSDFPGCAVIEDLMDMYPDAKIVLNKRPGGGNSWAKSIAAMTYMKDWPFYAITFLWKTDRNLHAFWHLYMDLCMKKYGLEKHELFTAKHYDAHNAWVLAEAAKRGREVLEHEPQDGWEPLCKFLGKEVPENEPYPHLNDAAEIRKITRILYGRGILSWIALIGVTFGTAKWIGLV